MNNVSNSNFYGYFLHLGSFGRVDLYGNPVKRTKEQYPYTFDDFVTWRNGENNEANCTIYSDRLIREPKYEELAKKHFKAPGQLFYQRTPEEIEAFFRDFFNNPNLKLIVVMEGCNQASGFPIWTFLLKN